MNLNELKDFIDELNKVLETKKKNFSSFKASTNLQEEPENKIQSSDDYKRPLLTETEIKVYVTINHYFRLVMVSIPNLSIAYEIWLKSILAILLNELGLTTENWDTICTIGDHTLDLQKRVDNEWIIFLKDLKEGNINYEVLELIQKGKKRSNTIMKRKMTRKKRPN